MKEQRSNDIYNAKTTQIATHITLLPDLTELITDTIVTLLEFNIVSEATLNLFELTLKQNRKTDKRLQKYLTMVQQQNRALVKFSQLVFAMPFHLIYLIRLE